MKHPRARLCLIEDDAIMGESLVQRFSFEGVACEWFVNARDAMRALQQRPFAAIVSDIRLPDLSGEALFEQLQAGGSPVPPSIFVTGYGTIDQAVRLMNLGARDYITKPFDIDELLEKLRLIVPELFTQGQDSGDQPVLGVSPAMRHLQETACRVAPSSATVLISGESGVGKEHVAQFVHQCCTRDADRPFVAINCAALPENLIEAELFGHERGAFTGALKSHRGLFERSSGGTLFLDEIGEMPTSMQAKLLRAVQEKTITRLGGEQGIQVDSRLICATNKDLRQLVREGRFREDLFYRINVVHLPIPPLRERREDILWFARLFLDEISHETGVMKRLLPAGEQYLLAQDWPGNLRELRHTIERASVLSRSEVLGLAELQSNAGSAPTSLGKEDLRSRMEEYERQLIVDTLKTHKGRIGETADALGISRKSLWEKLKKYGVNASDQLDD